MNKHLNIWVSWFILTAALLVVIVPGLGYWPKIMHDEIQILDFGRVILDPDTEWAASWLTIPSEPYLILSYMGVVLQEAFYLLFAPSNFGPRFATLIGAIAASGLLLKYLLQRRTPQWVALVLVLVFFADPIFNGSYRQGRLDSWAFVLIFLSCSLFLTAIDRSHRGKNSNYILMAVGCLATISFFVWPSAVSLFPLLLLEYFYFLKVEWSFHQHSFLKAFAKPTCWIVSGAVVAAILSLGPVVSHWDLYLISFEEGARVQKTAATIQRSFFGMYVLYNPLILPASVTALLIRREIGLILAFAVTLLMMYQTMIYPMRILYLLPYYILAIAGAYTVISQNRDIRWRHAILFVALTSLFVWNSWVSLIQRPLIAHQVAESRPIQDIQSQLQSAIGHGSYRVLIFEWDVYYAARSLDWEYYKLFGTFRPKSDEFKEFVNSMDYVIIRDKFPFLRGIDVAFLESLNFTQKDKVSFVNPTYDGILSGPFKVTPTETAYDSLLVYENPRRLENQIKP